MNTTIKPAFTIIAAMVAALPAFGQLAKEGAVDHTLCFGGPTHTVVGSQTARFGTYAITGGTQSADQVFNAMGLECAGTYAVLGGYQHKGFCLYQDASGDRIFGSDSTSAQGYTWEYLGGTGKFQGITGSGKIEILGKVAQVREGTMQGCRRVTGAYKLP